MSSIVLGLLLGSLLAFILGDLNTQGFSSENLFHFYAPIPFKFGLSFNFYSFLGIALISLITAIAAIGYVTASSIVSGEPIKGKVFDKRIAGGVLADGVNSGIAAIFNSFPNSIFSQNNGIIQLTGVASRYVGCLIGVLLILVGLIPGVGSIFSLIPEPVLGGATLLMFGTVATAGIRIIA